MDPAYAEGLEVPGVPVITTVAPDGTVDPLGDLQVKVDVEQRTDRKIQLVAERSPEGLDDWSHSSNLFPYYSAIPELDNSVGPTITFEVPKRTLQAGYDYRFRARQWINGQGGDPTEWTDWVLVTTARSTNNPIAPYPLGPKGPVPPAGHVLRADDSALESWDGSDITDLDFEIRTLHKPFVADLDTVAVWSKTVPYATAGQETEATVDSCQQIPGCRGVGEDTSLTVAGNVKLRWRVRANDTAGRTSDWSRWRYVDTADTTEDFWYVPHRAGSYVAGSAGGDEASGLTASPTYPGVYWFIRDNGGNEDRRKLYAIKIDPNTRRLDNISGYPTRAITVVGADNVDWETVEADGKGNLWIGDVGDYYRKDDPGLPAAEAAGQARDRNNSAEPDLQMIRIPEPNPYTDTTVAVSKVAPFAYPDSQSYNSEAMFWVDNYLFVVTKSQPQKIYGFNSWISSKQENNVLRLVGELPPGLDPLTDAAITPDKKRLALTTASKRVVVFDGPGGDTPQTRNEADALVKALLIDQDPRWHYYYRSAGALEADGTLAVDRPEAGQTRQTTMQVEGVAFSSELDLAMISEFGKHIMYVPADDSDDTDEYWWTKRPGNGTDVAVGATPSEAERADGVFIAPGSQWAYLDTGRRPAGFYDPDYQLTADWKTGSAPLGAGDPAQTSINRDSPWHTTDYFRRDFEITGDIPTTLELTLKVDDGAVIFINGKSVVRNNVPHLPILLGEVDTATRTITGNDEGKEPRPYKISNPPVHVGMNSIAVEVHQADSGSSDTMFDLGLRRGATLAPGNFEVQGTIDREGLDLAFTWDAQEEGTVYHLERRDLLTENPTWEEVYLSTLPNVEFDQYNHRIDVSDWRLRAVTPAGETATTQARRLVFIQDEEQLISNDGNVLVSSLIDSAFIGTPPQTGITPFELAGEGATLIAESEVPGLVREAWKAGGKEVGTGTTLIALGGFGAGFLIASTYLYITADEEITLDGVVMKPVDVEVTPALAARQSAIQAITTELNTISTLNDKTDQYKKTMAKRCLNQYDKARETEVDPNNNPGVTWTLPDTDVDGLIDVTQADGTTKKVHPCEALPVWFPSGGDQRHPNAANFRGDAIKVYPPWIHQKRRAEGANRGWLDDQDWDDGKKLGGNEGIEAAKGCLVSARPATGSPQCDEFPEATTMAGGSQAVPQPALRWITNGENGSIGSVLRWQLYTKCNVTEDNVPFLVVPLTERIITVPPPVSVGVCPTT